jgi:hypothetical protein
MARKQRNSRDGGHSLGAVLTGFIMKLFFAVALVVLVLTLAQCTVKKPQSPSWNSQLIVPLVNRTYSMSELIRKMNQPGVGFDLDSNVIFSVSRDLDTFRLNPADLTVGGLSYSTGAMLGAFSITTPVVAPVNVPIASIGPLAAATGTTIPPTSFSVTNDLPAISSLSSATVNNGLVYLVVTNNLGIDLSTVDVTLYDIGTAQTLGIQSFPSGLATGSTDSVTFDLSGKDVSNQIRATLDCVTAAGTVLAAGVQDVTMQARFSSPFDVTSATAQIPALSRSFSQTVSLAKSTPVYQATLAGGRLVMAITNSTPLASSLEITFPDLLQNGLPLVVNRSLAANATVNDTVNLAGCVLTPSDSTTPQSIGVDIVASSTGSGASLVMVDQNHSFDVSVDLNNLSLQSVTGVIAPTNVAIDPVDQSITVPQGFDSVQLAHATLSLDITSAVDLPGSLTVQVQGNNGKTLSLTGTVARGSVGSPTLTVIADTSVADFLWPLPSSISVTGTASFGDNVTAGTLTTSDFVHARIRINAPLELILHQSTVRPDLSKESLDSNAMDNIADHIIEARLVYTLENHLPLGARINLYLNGDSAGAYTSPQVTIDNLFIDAAPVDGAGIVSSAASTGEQIVPLDSVDFQVLRNRTLWIANEIIIDSTGSQPVKLTAQDYVGIVGRLEIEYRFDGKF